MLSSSRHAMILAVLASLSLLSSVHGSIDDSSSFGKSNYTFPEGFIMGVSTAAFQIEGGWNADGRGESMWDTYLHNNPSFTADGQNGDVAADSYHRWRDDVAIIEDLGVKYYRMSISWPRILPNGTDNYVNKAGVEYYRTLFKELQRINVTVLVTLYHWDLPTALMDLGGWANPKMVDYFEDYARVAFTELGDLVNIWTTINEPHQHCFNGYGNTNFVPALNAHGIGEYLCSHYLLLAHARAYHLYNNEFRRENGKIGITLDAFWATPKDPTKREDHEAAEMYMKFHLDLYAHPIYSETGDYPLIVRQKVEEMSRKQGYVRSRLPRFTDEEIDLLRGSSDFFGLNHYTTYLMSFSKNQSDFRSPSMDEDSGVVLEQHKNWPKPGAEWFSIYPPGFRKLLNYISNQYGNSIPIIVTENGMCDWGGSEDYTRVSYYNKYLYQLLLAMFEDNCNVQGYFAWTLMDDFEWTDGYKSKFGIYDVDYSSPERTRTPKLSAYNYKEIVRTRQIDFDYIKPTTHRPNVLV